MQKIDNDLLFNTVVDYIETTLCVKYYDQSSSYKIVGLYNEDESYNSSLILYSELVRIFGLKSSDNISIKIFNFCNNWYNNKIIRFDSLTDIIINGYLKNCIISLGDRSWVITYNGETFNEPESFIKYIMQREVSWLSTNKRLKNVLTLKIYDLIINESEKIMGC